jgi:hypothetical protein
MLLRRAMAGLRRLVRMSVPVCIMDPKAGQPQWMMEASDMKDHNGVLMMQRVLLAGTLGMAMARKAAAILEGEPSHAAPSPLVPDGAGSPCTPGGQDLRGATSFREPQGAEGAVLRAILDAANECLGHFDDRPAGERWCDTLFHLLDLAAFAAELG